MEAHRARQRENIISWALYVASIVIFMSGLSYAAVPLYKLVCSVTSIDGTPKIADLARDGGYEHVRPVEGARKLRIHFNADVSQTLGWKFRPQTREIRVLPGETALAFFTASNDSDEDVIGISTYSVVPAKAAQYFNKIQCFCFEEQKLLAKESVDMPVFFFIDPAFADDPWMQDVDDITLSYCFFK
ncbi:Cytochrome c oxidase assembly protein cox11, mitochondrial [Gonapodya sp. JEL0774]|nr:Cytochrome c oxidase assembly protein cox11, mitochondrial [Gonapodya sp. JEL0774]